MLKYTRFASKVFKQFRVQFSIVLIFVYDNASMKKPYIIKKINLQSNNLGSDLKVDLDGKTIAEKALFCKGFGHF